jgi:hypothetical protein
MKTWGGAAFPTTDQKASELQGTGAGLVKILGLDNPSTKDFSG